MSQIVMAMETLRDRLERHMRRDPKLKDDDKALVTSIWYEDLQALGRDPRVMNATGFIDMYLEGKLPVVDLITRTRRKIQEEDPNFRGQLWGTRHRQKKEVKETINNVAEAAKRTKPKSKPKYSI